MQVVVLLQVIGDTFGVDKSTVSRAITDVSRALAAKQPRFIKWPLTHDECAKIKIEFYIRGGFPGVVGCVDGTHVRSQAKQLCQQKRFSFHQCTRCLQP